MSANEIEESSTTYENWSKTQIINLEKIYTPENVEQVTDCLQEVKRRGGKMRCCSAGHSWSPIFPDDGTYLMDMRNYGKNDSDQRIQFVYDYNKKGEPLFLDDVPKTTEKGFVSTPIGVLIYPSVTTGELADVLLQRGLALPCNVILPGVHFGGVVATVCHGNLGLLGVVVRMALEVQPTVLVSDQNDFVTYTVDDFFPVDSNNSDKLKKHVEGNLSVEIFWFPFNSIEDCQIPNVRQWKLRNDKLWVKTINQEKSNEKPMSQLVLSIKEDVDVLFSKVFSLISPLVQKCPGLTPVYLNTAHFFLSKLNTWKNEPVVKHTMLPQAIHYQGGIEELLVYDMEFAFPVKKDFSNIIEAANRVFNVVQKDFNEGRTKADYPLNVALEMRFMGTSDVLLCPAFSRSTDEQEYSGYTCYIEVLSLAPEHPDEESSEKYTEKWKKFCRDVAESWMNMEDKPIPHWAKQWEILHTNSTNIYDYIRKAYGERIQDFNKARSKYDPDGMLMNKALGNVFNF